jgi:hypothetical protein
MKICSKCKIKKGLLEFSKRAKSNSGLQPKCKVCVKEYDREYYLINFDIVNKKNTLWNITNKEKVVEYQRSYHLKYRLINNSHLNYKTDTWRKNNLDKCNANCSRYRASKLNQTPPWVGEIELKRIILLYKEAQRLTMITGIQHHIDHIVPLRSSIVSGFHCLANLQILIAHDNISKGNRWWPDMP